MSPLLFVASLLVICVVAGFFGVVLAASAATMIWRARDSQRPVPPDPWADRLQLHGRYFDESQGRVLIVLSISFLLGKAG